MDVFAGLATLGNRASEGATAESGVATQRM